MTTPNPSTQPTTTPSSSLSISPQTPFSPPLATSPTNASSFFRYASALSKSPTSQPSILTQRGFAPIQSNHQHEQEHDHHHPENHDSFEFGDYGDLKSKSWTGGVNRRVASISGTTGIGQGQGQGQGGAQGLGIMAGLAAGKEGGVMADKAAKGQGVLRRLSLTGSSFTRPTFLSPTLSTPATAIPAPKEVAQPQPDNDGGGLHRSASVSVPGPSAAALRGRRLSESSKKRGVSPMGERLLRDHGHF